MHLNKRLIARFLLALPLLAGSLALAQQPGAPAVLEPPVKTEAADWSPLDEDWMTVEIGGSRVGWMSTLVDQSGDRIRTRTSSKMSIGRGAATPVTIAIDSTFLETADGKPLSMSFTQDMAASVIETKWEFKGDKIVQTSTQSGRTTTREFDKPTVEWMTPWKADRFAREQRRAGAAEFKVVSLDPQNGVKPINTATRRDGDAEYEIDGVKTKVEKWRTISDINPVEAVEYVDTGGDVVYQEIPMGVGKIVMRETTKAEAMADVPGSGAPEIMAKSFAKPDKPIENSFKSVTAKFKLTAREGKLPEMPSAGAQRVEMSADGKSAVLTIDIKTPQAASEAEITDKAFTETSTMVDFDDPLVSKLAARAKGESDAMAKALALRKIVYRHISKKGMATAFASASETARTQTGDCSEHGVLLAAMLRSQGIPSRVALGLIYAPEFMGEKGIFGWHMWSQALIDGKWIDLDATLPVTYCASHILTGTASLADGIGASDMAGIMQLLGNLDVEVLEVGYAE